MEQLGAGIIRILKLYNKDVYEFSDNFIRVNFKFKDSNTLQKSPTDIKNMDLNLNETQ